tara:strand:+ start:157 stop:447 length:291 start_codon:yes stop_codon:yes gene_type:complete
MSNKPKPAVVLLSHEDDVIAILLLEGDSITRSLVDKDSLGFTKKMRRYEVTKVASKDDSTKGLLKLIEAYQSVGNFKEVDPLSVKTIGLFKYEDFK